MVALDLGFRIAAGHIDPEVTVLVSYAIESSLSSPTA